MCAPTFCQRLIWPVSVAVKQTLTHWAALSNHSPVKLPATAVYQSSNNIEMTSHSMSVAVMLLLTAAASVTAQEALSAWNEGVATNYGGSSEGLDANAASYGLQDVSDLLGDHCS